MRKLPLFAFLMLVFLISIVSATEESGPTRTADSPPDSLAQEVVDGVVVYYFHGNRRCRTCKKLEAYSREAVDSGFASELAESAVSLRVVNFEAEENEHFTKEYGLYSASLVLSRFENDKEVAWKNLDRIWKLVSDKKEFVAYVQSELRAFLEPAPEPGG